MLDDDDSADSDDDATSVPSIFQTTSDPTVENDTDVLVATSQFAKDPGDEVLVYSRPTLLSKPTHEQDAVMDNYELPTVRLILGSEVIWKPRAHLQPPPF